MREMPLNTRKIVLFFCFIVFGLIFSFYLLAVDEKEIIPWGHKRIGLEEAWKITKGKGIKVAIIDTGINKFHPDLRYQYKEGKTFLHFLRKDYEADFQDFDGHGTFVAGIIAAKENGQGIIGVAPQAELYIAKVFGFLSGESNNQDLAKAIDWAIEKKVQVINLSLSSLFNYKNTDFNYKNTEKAIKRAYQAGIVIVASAGNRGDTFCFHEQTEVRFPARLKEVIAVGAIDEKDQLWQKSCQGPELDFVAPGKDILSTYLNIRDLTSAEYIVNSGTSFSSAYVSGLVALILSRPIKPEYDKNKNSKWDPDEVKQRLIDTAEDLGQPGKDDLYGYGLVRADRAVK